MQEAKSILRGCPVFEAMWVLERLKAVAQHACGRIGK
jgi:hypothetical protein